MLEPRLVSGKEKRFWEGVLGASWGNAVSMVSQWGTGIDEDRRWLTKTTMPTLSMRVPTMKA